VFKAAEFHRFTVYMQTYSLQRQIVGLYINSYFLKIKNKCVYISMKIHEPIFFISGKSLKSLDRVFLILRKLFQWKFTWTSITSSPLKYSHFTKYNVTYRFCVTIYWGIWYKYKHFIGSKQCCQGAHFSHCNVEIT